LTELVNATARGRCSPHRLLAVAAYRNPLFEVSPGRSFDMDPLEPTAPRSRSLPWAVALILAGLVALGALFVWPAW
jgi:hypothetical protein